MRKQVGGRFMATLLVIGKTDLSEIGRLKVKGNGGIIGLYRVKMPQNDIQHSIDRVGRLAVLGVKRTDAVKGAVQNAVSVDDEC